MPLRRTPEQKAEQAAMFERERQQTVVREMREGRGGYTMHDNYGVTANGDGTLTIGFPFLDDSVTLPFAGAHAEIETLADARPRVTATRVAALGVLALAVPRADKRLLLVITNGGTEVVNLVDGTDPVHLRRWVAAFNTQAATPAAD